MLVYQIILSCFDVKFGNVFIHNNKNLKVFIFNNCTNDIYKKCEMK